MTKDEALDLALDALEAHADIGIKSDKAITAIKQARSAPVQPVMTDEKGRPISFWGGKSVEPIKQTAPASWMETVTANLVREGVNKHKARELAEHFYSLAQRPFVGLTNEERFALEYTPQGVKRSPIQMSFATEAKLRSKNNENTD